MKFFYLDINLSDVITNTIPNNNMAHQETPAAIPVDDSSNSDPNKEFYLKLLDDYKSGKLALILLL